MYSMFNRKISKITKYKVKEVAMAAGIILLR
jgi:hypothetical protein